MAERTGSTGRRGWGVAWPGAPGERAGQDRKRRQERASASEHACACQVRTTAPALLR